MATPKADRIAIDGKEVDELVAQLRDVCQGHSTRAILVALTEIYGRVLSHTVYQEAEMEKALLLMTDNARGWWHADRGRSFFKN